MNKADGNLIDNAKMTLSQYKHTIHLIHQTNSSDWEPKVLTCSSLQKENIDKVWNSILEFQDFMIKKGRFEEKRKEQNKKWMWQQIHEEMVKRIENLDEMNGMIHQMIEKVENGQISPKIAAQELIDTFLKIKN